VIPSERQAGEPEDPRSAPVTGGEPNGSGTGVTAGGQERRQPAGQLHLLDDVAGNKVVQTYLALADQFTAQLGYTEHGYRHANLVGRIAFNILDRLGRDRHLAELAGVAGYLHDVGNVVSRQNHPQTSALISMPILTEMGLTTEDIGLVIGAIGNHEEEMSNAV